MSEFQQICFSYDEENITRGKEVLFLLYFQKNYLIDLFTTNQNQSQKTSVLWKNFHGSFLETNSIFVNKKLSINI